MATKTKVLKDAEIYQLKITLNRSKPAIWRRVDVPSAWTLADLHVIAQLCMGWEGGHLHQFIVKGKHYTAKDKIFDDADADISLPSETIALKDAFTGEKSKIVYEYDFGDGWEHDIELEKIKVAEPDIVYPNCTAGKMACPLEDCGGIFGYYRLLEILQNPDHDEYEDMLEWADGEIDPEDFSVEEVNMFLGVVFIGGPG